MRFLVFGVLLVAAWAHAATKDDSCTGAVVEIFGGKLSIPCGFRLKPEFENTIRFVRFESDPRQPNGNIYIGKASDLSTQEARDRDAAELGAKIERKTFGQLSVEIMRRTTRQLLNEGPVTYVSALIYDDQHYVRVADSDPNLWQLLEAVRRLPTVSPTTHSNGRLNTRAAERRQRASK